MKNKKQMSKTSKNNPLIIIAVFIGLALFTILVPDDKDKEKDSEKKDNTENVQEESGDVDQSNEKKLSKDSAVVVSHAFEGDPYEELDNLVGLESVKQEVRSLANFVKVQKQREAQGMKTTTVSYHCVFTGSPGTGKTTIARILAAIYKDLGVVKSGHLVETDRAGLIAAYEGQTALKTNRIIDQALDGVLFIDEAYALLETNGGYGAEAVSTLLKRMEDDRDRLVVIVAGYTNEMKNFIDSNPGLQSRFTRYIDFPDYSSADLFKIFMLRAKKYGYVLDKDAAAYLQKSLDNTVAHKSRNFGNARYARNVFEKAITNQANRLGSVSNPTKAQLSQLTLADIQNACETTKN